MKEFDVYLKIDKEKIHDLSYIVEVEDNLVNIRRYEDGLLRLIVPSDLKDDLLELLEGVREVVPFEIAKIEVNPGSAG